MTGVEAYDGPIVAKRIGELLVDGGVLSQSQLEQALFAQRKDGRKLGQILIELRFVSEVQVTQTLSRQLSVPWVSLYHVDFSRSLLNRVPREVAEKYFLVPIFVRRVRKEGETLYVAMDDPTNEAAIAEVSSLANLPVKPMIACPSDIRAAIRVYYLGEAPPAPVQPLRAAPTPPLTPTPPASPAPRGEPDSRPASPLPPQGQPRNGARPGATTEPAVPAAMPTALPPTAAEPPPPAPALAPAAADTSTSGTMPAAAEARPEVPAPPEEEDEPTPAPVHRASMAPVVAVVLADGKVVQLPGPPPKREGGEGLNEELTARDLVSALRAVARGVDASEILGEQPRWEAMFSALLSLLLRRGLIADWEFVEEFRKL